jgi:hypothetical protein
MSQFERVRIMSYGLALSLSAGAALIASARRKEAVGGVLLLLASLLTTVLATLEPNCPLLIGVLYTSLVWNPEEFLMHVLPISTMVLPPSLAGVLFLACHRSSRPDASKLEGSPEDGNWGVGLRWVAIALSTLLAPLLLAATGVVIIPTIMGNSPKMPPGREWEEILITWVVGLYFVGYALGWFRPLWGGVFIVLSGFLFSFPLFLVRGQFAGVTIGIPLTVCGIGLLFVLSYVVRKKQRVG